jgi:hypothetical protein
VKQASFLLKNDILCERIVSMRNKTGMPERLEIDENPIAPIQKLPTFGLNQEQKNK